MRQLNEREQTIVDAIKSGHQTTHDIAKFIYGDTYDFNKKESDRISQCLFYLTKDGIIKSKPIENDHKNRKMYMINDDTQESIEACFKTCFKALDAARDLVFKPQVRKVDRIAEKTNLLEEIAGTSNAQRAELLRSIIGDLK